MNKHVNKVRKATGRAEAITAGRQQNKQQYLIIQLMKKKESIKTGQERQQSCPLPVAFGRFRSFPSPVIGPLISSLRCVSPL